MLRLTAVLGRPATDTSGTLLGKLEDFAVDPAAAHPPLVGVRLRSRRCSRDHACERVRLADGLIVVEGVCPAPAVEGRLLLRRHVLDSQVIDLEGRRLLRVGDVVLDDRDGLVLAGVEVGVAPVLRRLGLRRISTRTSDELLDWSELHLASAPGHVLQLRGGRSAIHRLAPTELEGLAAVLPPARARELRRHFGLPHPTPSPPTERRRRRGRRFGSVLRSRPNAPR